MRQVGCAMLLLVLTSCQYAKPACAVVDVAHAACEYVTVEYLDDDGNVVREQVPKAELRSLAVKSKAMREGTK